MLLIIASVWYQHNHNTLDAHYSVQTFTAALGVVILPIAIFGVVTQMVQKAERLFFIVSLNFNFFMKSSDILIHVQNNLILLSMTTLLKYTGIRWNRWWMTLQCVDSIRQVLLYLNGFLPLKSNCFYLVYGLKGFGLFFTRGTNKSRFKR